VKRLAIAALLICTPLAAVFPQTAAEDIKKIDAAVEARDRGVAVQLLRELEVRDQKAFVSGDYDYLLARMAEANGDLGTAMANYQRAAIRGSMLRPYALAHMARIARSTGNLMLERLYLFELLHQRGGGDLLIGPAAERLARNYFETGNYAQAINVLIYNAPAGAAGGRAGDGSRDVQILLGDAYQNAGDGENARRVFTSVLNSTKDLSRPDDAAAHS
jgi:hypothetical protein